MKEKLTVLVVEDEKLLLEAISRKLTISGITPIACDSGEKALTWLKDVNSLPSAIWLDYSLKDMDGITFMSKMKGHSVWAKIPVIVVSNSASNEKVYTMLALGAKQYLLKAEHRLDDIIATVRQMVEDDAHEK